MCAVPVVVPKSGRSLRRRLPLEQARVRATVQTMGMSTRADGEVEWPRDIARAAAPWLLRGDAFLVLTASTTEQNLADASINPSLRGVYNNLFNALVLADYRESPVGPFRELLYIPGRFRFGVDEERLCISRSYASSEVARVNRREHWGVPSALAPITRTAPRSDREEFRVGDDGFASFAFETFGPDLPLNGKVIPRAFRAFAQLEGDRTFLYTLAITGTMRAARFEPLGFDVTRFPDMSQREMVLAIKISDFLVEFPAAQAATWTTA